MNNFIPSQKKKPHTHTPPRNRNYESYFSLFRLFLNKLMYSPLPRTDKTYKLRHVLCLNHPDVYFVPQQSFLIHTPDSQMSLQLRGSRFLHLVEKSRLLGSKELPVLSPPKSSWIPSELVHYRTILLMENNSVPDAPIIGI